MENTQEKTLYSIHNKKKWIYRSVWMAILASYFIVYAIMQAAGVKELGNSAVVGVYGVGSTVLLIVFICLTVMEKKKVKSICPFCKNEFRELVNDEITETEGYYQGESFGDKVTVKEKITKEKHAVTYRCSACGEVWTQEETVDKHPWPF